jgi:hypothetical protein
VADYSLLMCVLAPCPQAGPACFAVGRVSVLWNVSARLVLLEDDLLRIGLSSVSLCLALATYSVIRDPWVSFKIYDHIIPINFCTKNPNWGHIIAENVQPFLK